RRFPVEMVNPSVLNKRKNDLDDLSDTDSINEKEMNKIVNDVEKEDAKKNPDSRWAKMKASVREWGETSSCHGIPHMAAASSLFATVVWSIILALCAIGFIYLFSDTLRQYLKFDKIVKLNLGLESTNFPSVTFCNINPYKLSKIKDVPELEALLEVYKNSGDG
ncbi:hypothetical protein PFISCL1PPCAC_14827, partial [Pristionchus fissidentatus]